MNILQLLPQDVYNAAISAAAPTGANPFATIADLVAPTLQTVMSAGSTATITTDVTIATNGLIGISTEDAPQLVGLASLQYDPANGVLLNYLDYNTFGVMSVDINPTGMLVSDSILSIGFKYAADYSAAGTLSDRWIPDYGAVKAYVAATPAVNLYNANGNLTSARTVTMAGFPLTFTGGDVTIKGASGTKNLLHADESLDAIGIGNVAITNTKLYLKTTTLTTGIRVDTSTIVNQVRTLNGGGVTFNDLVTIGGQTQNQAVLFIQNIATSSFSRLRVDSDYGQTVYVTKVGQIGLIPAHVAGQGGIGIGVNPASGRSGNPYVKIESQGVSDNILGIYKNGSGGTPTFFIDSTESVIIGGGTSGASKLTLTTGDVETVANGKGLIVADATTGTRYRIYMDNGVLSSQLA